jgi:uncharacterized membrane protein YdfJ with MMPL/SSD domain
VLILTLVIMAVSFGSLSLAAATVTLNALSVAAAYGILTLVFQGTWAESLLGFTSTGAIAARRAGRKPIHATRPSCAWRSIISRKGVPGFVTDVVSS